MNETIADALDELIRKGERVLAGYSERGNIDQHDLWFQAARSFLAVNNPELEQRLLAVAPKYRDSLLFEAYGRAAYMLIQEQLEVVKLARYRLVNASESKVEITKPPSTWQDDLDKALEVKPGLFGISVNLKEIFKAMRRRVKQ